METITSFPLGKPVVSSSTTAEIASDSGTMRPTRQDELVPFGRFGKASQGLWRRIGEHQVMSRWEQTANHLGGGGDDMPRRFSIAPRRLSDNAPAASPD